MKGKASRAAFRVAGMGDIFIEEPAELWLLPEANEVSVSTRPAGHR